MEGNLILLTDPNAEPVVIGGGGWNIGETRQLQSNLARYDFGGMTLLKRSIAQTALESEFPLFYSLATPGTPQAYMVGRTVSPLATVTAARCNGTTVIAVNAQGEIARSQDAGISFTKRTSPVTVPLYEPLWANDRWVIPYNGGYLLSVDDGNTWTSVLDPKITGLSVGVSTRAGHLIQVNEKILHLPPGVSDWVEVAAGISKVSKSLRVCGYNGGTVFFTEYSGHLHHTSDANISFVKGQPYKPASPNGPIEFMAGYFVRGGHIRTDGPYEEGTGLHSASGAIAAYSKDVSSFPKYHNTTVYSDDNSLYANTGKFWQSAGYAFLEIYGKTVEGVSIMHHESGRGGYTPSPRLYSDENAMAAITGVGTIPRYSELPMAPYRDDDPYAPLFMGVDSAITVKPNTNQLAIRASGAPQEAVLPALSGTAVNYTLLPGHNFYTRVG
jgi:hypothetical protein